MVLLHSARSKNFLVDICTVSFASAKGGGDYPVPKFIKYILPSFYKEKCKSEVVRCGNIIIFYLSKQWKAKFFIVCDVIFLVRLQEKLEIDYFRE